MLPASLPCKQMEVKPWQPTPVAAETEVTAVNHQEDRGKDCRIEAVNTHLRATQGKANT